jgi:hypothetical protein
LESISTFSDLLYSVSVRGHKEDKLCWKPSNQKGIEVGAKNFPWKIISKPKVPTRVAFFTWPASLGKILIADYLRKRNIVLLSWCCMCKGMLSC